MRILPAVLVMLGTAVAFAQGFRIGQLTTYSGSLPCADCVGIRYVLSLRPDGLFYRQRSYMMHSESSGQKVLELGFWYAANSTLTLTSTTQETEVFSVTSNNALQLLDRDGKRVACPDAQEGECSLTREARAQIPAGSYRVRGIYREAFGRRTFQPCGTALQFSADDGGRALLQKIPSAPAGGKFALITVIGAPEKAAAPQSGEILRIASVLTAHSGMACPAKLPGSVMPRNASPVANGTANPSEGLAARLLETAWVLTELDHAPTPAGVGESEASVRFMQDRRIAGFTGCNRFSGAYNLSGRFIRLGPVVTTRMACPASADIEAVYVKALENARQIDFHGDAFELLDEAGRRVARFRAVNRR